MGKAEARDTSLTLEDGARVAVVGGGPAGSMTAYFLLTLAQRVDLNIAVDIYEPRDFTQPGPGGCNMCGGIVSESLIQSLAAEGINLPATVVQRGIESYVLHSEEASVRIETPLREKRIAAVHRGGGPRDRSEAGWGGLDAYLLGLAQQLGAQVLRTRVSDVAWDNGRPQIRLKGEARTYDLLVGAFGVNSSGWQIIESLGLQGKRPDTTKTYITEMRLGAEAISQYFGDAMHIFFLNLPRLDCAAIIPKGEFVTVCLLGQDIDNHLIEQFFGSEPVKRCFPPGWEVREGACHCAPRINVREATQPFADRVVLVGDCGATRLYKDGIGAAYRTAKPAALTAVLHGVSAQDFQRHYWPAYRNIVRDNWFGKFIFEVVHIIKSARPLVRGCLRTARVEQSWTGGSRPMSTVLWDMFTGSAPYRDVFYRTLDPRFLGRFMWESALALRNGRTGKGERVGH